MKSSSSRPYNDGEPQKLLCVGAGLFDRLFVCLFVCLVGWLLGWLVLIVYLLFQFLQMWTNVPCQLMFVNKEAALTELVTTIAIVSPGEQGKNAIKVSSFFEMAFILPVSW